MPIDFSAQKKNVSSTNGSLPAAKGHEYTVPIPHIHIGNTISGGACYQNVTTTLTCGKAEHTHGSSCEPYTHWCKGNMESGGWSKKENTGKTGDHNLPVYKFSGKVAGKHDSDCPYSTWEGTNGNHPITRYKCNKSVHTHSSSCYTTTYSLSCTKTVDGYKCCRCGALQQ